MLPQQEDEQDTLTKPSVLIVDDTPENLVALEVVLDDIDCDVVTASSGNQALSKLLKQEFALVLLDVQMPVMDGYTATQTIREKALSNIPIIGLSANAMKEDKLKGASVGMNDYLTKPIHRSTLIEKLTHYLGETVAKH